MVTFPTDLTAAAPLRYPLMRSVRFNTTVCKYLDDSETRWSTHSRMESFRLRWPNITRTQLSSLKTFMDSQRGMGVQGMSFALDGVTYANCMFDSDSFSFTESVPERYNASLTVRQFLPPTPPSAVIATSFPTLSNGATFQRGYTAASNWLTMRVDIPASDKVYVATDREAPLGAWNVSYAILTQPEAETLEAFFVAHKGRLVGFQFTDPLEVIHPNCRFGQDNLDLQYIDGYPKYSSGHVTPGHLFTTNVSVEEFVR